MRVFVMIVLTLGTMTASDQKPKHQVWCISATFPDGCRLSENSGQPLDQLVDLVHREMDSRHTRSCRSLLYPSFLVNPSEWPPTRPTGRIRTSSKGCGGKGWRGHE